MKTNMLFQKCLAFFDIKAGYSQGLFSAQYFFGLQTQVKSHFDVLLCVCSFLDCYLVVERVAKSRVLNSKKSNLCRLGWEFRKDGFEYPKSQVFCRVSCTFYSKFYVLFHKVGFG